MPPDSGPLRIRLMATVALREGKLHPDAWAMVDDLLLDGDRPEAVRTLARHLHPFGTFPLTPGPRELGQQRLPTPCPRFHAPVKQERL